MFAPARLSVQAPPTSTGFRAQAGALLVVLILSTAVGFAEVAPSAAETTGSVPQSVEPTATKYLGFDAFKFSDGKTEAVVVPALGRVMRYGLAGGANLLWNAPPSKKEGRFHNWGGDKTFVGPHPVWGLFSPKLWPPQPTWDGPPHTAEVLSGGRLRTVGGVWDGPEIRVVREYMLNSKGEFVIDQTIEALADLPVNACVWQVAQATPPDGIFFLLNPASAYREGYHWCGHRREGAKIGRAGDSLLKVTPGGGSYKIGLDSPVAGIVAVWGEVAWTQWTAKEDGEYPDGAIGAGFPVEFYNGVGDGPDGYVELELLSPLQLLRRGGKLRMTTRWTLTELPGNDLEAPDVGDAVIRLLKQ